MKRENDELPDFFRSHLNDAETPVREGFWEELNQGLATCHHRRLLFTRIMAAASVLLVLAASSAAFLYFSPKEEIEEAFIQVAVANGGSLSNDGVKQVTQPVQPKPILPQIAFQKPVGYIPYPDTGEDSASITVSMSVSISINSTMHRGTDRVSRRDSELWKAGKSDEQTTAPVEQESPAAVQTASAKARYWALKMAVGTSIPTGNGTSGMPITGALTVERQLNNYLAIETGLQYTNLGSQAKNLHYIGIPLKMNVTLVQTNKVSLYGLIGGIADKCIAGAPSHKLKDEPIQLAVMGGVGIDYKVNDRIALFAEPTVSHHFRTESKQRSVRTERPTNVNLVCGLRMTY